VGEDTFVRTAGGYAANVEAVTTVAPDPVDWTDLPAAHVEPTPDTPTIATLVDASNSLQPRADRPWTAADTLKNVVVAVTHANGEREIVVIGLPGDREVDLGRAEGTGRLGEGEIDVEPATEADLASLPQLVKGYIGPGESLDAPFLGLEGASGLRYLVDPRVAEGTRWVTGANVHGHHVFDLVYGRDFTADGLIEASEVRAGDPAPDGSGPLELARGVEIGQVFKLGRKYAEAMGLTVLDENGKSRVVTMGSYGVGVSRVLACIAEEHHDDRGLIWPQHLAPADVHIVATGKDAEVYETAESLTTQLEAQGVRVLIDDRPKTSPGVKFGDAELFGIPTILVVGRGLKDGSVELRNRADGTSRDVPVADAVQQTVEQVDAGYALAGGTRTDFLV
jgi:prolyl-tRNA synthetase